MYPSFTSATTTVLLPPVLGYLVCSDESCRNNGGSRVAQLPRGSGKLIKRMCQTSEAAKLWRPAIIPFAFA